MSYYVPARTKKAASVGNSASSLHNLHHASIFDDELEAPLIRVASSDVENSPQKLDASKESIIFKALNWRLLPLFWAMVVMNYIDRTNLSFAAIQLQEDRGLTPEVFGFGSGLFFLTYASLQIPSNILLKNVGGPLWLSLIIAAWGICACAFAFMRTHAHFYILRTLLGVAEAGAFPGMWFMLSRFYPPDRITLAYAVVESGISLSHTMAGPLAAACLSMDSLLGLKGWQWLFLMEGAPSLVLAAVMAVLLPAGPEQAHFLTEPQRTYLSSRVAAAQGERAGERGASTREALHHAGTNRALWYMGFMKVLHNTAAFGIIFFTPMMVQAILKGQVLDMSAPSTSTDEGSGDAGIRAALITSIPFGCAAAMSFVVAHRSERMNERIQHTGVPYLLCGIVFAAFPLAVARSTLAGFACLVVGVVGVYSGSPPALALVTELGAGPGLVVALPMYNALGNIGGFIGPTLIGYMLTKWQSFAAPTILMGTSLAAAGAMVLLMPHSLRSRAKSGSSTSE